jgi:chromosome partitioning protein
METQLNEREAFKAVFSFRQTLDGLNAEEVPNLEKAKRNVWDFVIEVLERLKSEERAKAEEKDETSNLVGAA